LVVLSRVLYALRFGVGYPLSLSSYDSMKMNYSLDLFGRDIGLSGSS